MNRRYECPVDDCNWNYTDSTPWLPAKGQFMTVAELVKATALQHATQVEAVLAKHVESHTPIDFLRTIQRLNRELAKHAEVTGDHD